MQSQSLSSYRGLEETHEFWPGEPHLDPLPLYDINEHWDETVARHFPRREPLPAEIAALLEEQTRAEQALTRINARIAEACQRLKPLPRGLEPTYTPVSPLPYRRAYVPSPSPSPYTHVQGEYMRDAYSPGCLRPYAGGAGPSSPEAEHDDDDVGEGGGASRRKRPAHDPARTDAVFFRHWGAGGRRY